MRLFRILGGLALAASIVSPTLAADVKLGFITKFPVPFFATMENAAKAYAEANPGVEIIYGQGASATDIEGQIALIESMVTQGVQGIAITPVDPTVAAALDKAVSEGVEDSYQLQQTVRRVVGRWVSGTHRRRPMIIPVVLEA